MFVLFVVCWLLLLFVVVCSLLVVCCCLLSCAVSLLLLLLYSSPLSWPTSSYVLLFAVVAVVGVFVGCRLSVVGCLAGVGVRWCF